MRRRFFLFLLVTLVAFSGAFGDTRTVLVLHTNDFHDHIRAGYEGAGGMPYVSGYIASVKAERKDVLVLDGGDVMGKGDMLAHDTQSTVMYEAMNKIGYAAIAIGNHDIDTGVEHLRECQALAPNAALLCLNYFDTDGKPNFPVSKVFDIAGVKVGVIGFTVPKGKGFLDIKECGAALEKEAQRLKSEADIVIALGHAGSHDCADLAVEAPSIPVFVGAHSHEVLKQPVRVEKTGAYIVQAGSNARYVGRLELTVDTGKKTLVKAEGQLVEMLHDSTPCDKEMLEWVAQREREVCPAAMRVVAQTGKPLGSVEVARFIAEALRQKAVADVGLCHPNHVVRNGLPRGPIDINALFATCAERGEEVVAVTLSGNDIQDYLRDLMTAGKGQTEWAGFKATLGVQSREAGWTASSNLDPKREYRVVLPNLEWENRLVRLMKARAKAATEAGAPRECPEPSPCPFTCIEALTDYAEYLAKEGISIDKEIEKLAAKQKE